MHGWGRSASGFLQLWARKVLAFCCATDSWCKVAVGSIETPQSVLTFVLGNKHNTWNVDYSCRSIIWADPPRCLPSSQSNYLSPKKPGVPKNSQMMGFISSNIRNLYIYISASPHRLSVSSAEEIGTCSAAHLSPGFFGNYEGKQKNLISCTAYKRR